MRTSQDQNQVLIINLQIEGIRINPIYNKNHTCKMGSTQNKKKLQEISQSMIDNQSIRGQQQEEGYDSSDGEYQSSDEDEIINESNQGKPLIKVDANDLIKFPYNCIGLITGKNSEGLMSSGTGFLISNSFILTAAHVVADKKSNKILKNLKFYIDFQTILKDPIQIKTVRVPKEYYQKPAKLRQDYALCMLKKEIQRDKYIQIVNKFNNDLQKIMIAGYPAITETQEGQFQTDMKYSCGQQEKSILSINQKEMKIQYRISTVKGQSGSPVLISSYAVGIHKGKLKKIKKNGQTKNPNVSVLFNPRMIDNIKQWSLEMSRSKPYDSQILDYLEMRSVSHYHQLGDQISLQQQRTEHLYNRFPFCCIGRIKSENMKTKKSLYSNGILISQDLVLAVTSGILKGFKKEELGDLKISFQLGIKNKDSIQYQIDHQKLVKHEKIQEVLQDRTKILHKNFLQKIKDDFCLLKLKKPIENCPKYMSLLVNYSNKTDQTSFYGFTYSDINKNFNDYLSGTKTNQAISSISIDKKIIQHRFKTQVGQAGSPLIVKDYLIGFHKLKYRKQGKSIKIARLITLDLVQELFQWNVKLKGTSFEIGYYKSSGEIVKLSTVEQLRQHYLKDIKKQ